MDDRRETQAAAMTRDTAQTDELLRLAVEVGGIGIYATDLKQNRTRFSPELCAMLALPVGTEMTHEEASRLFEARDRAEVMAKVEAAATTAEIGRAHV